MTNQLRTRRQTGFTKYVAALGIAAVLTVVPGMDSATAAEPPAPAAKSVKTHVVQANSAIDRAIKKIRSHRYSGARSDLVTARHHIKAANSGAVALIGAQPTDPESDELPGPPAVLAALGLDNRVTTRVVPLFKDMNRSRVVYALRLTIWAAQARRDTVLNRVIALPAEGDGDDYADGMADTLPIYSREVGVIAHALQTFRLTPPATAALTDALGRARVAEAKMNAAYGGGERPASQR